MAIPSAIRGDRATRPTTSGRAVLIVGAARSGTTWAGQVLGRTDGALYLDEPDNPTAIPFAARATAGLGVFPVVEPGEAPPPLYGELWDTAFSARRRHPMNRLSWRMWGRVPFEERRGVTEPGRPASLRLRVASRLARPVYLREAECRVVKSVDVALALDWLVERWQPRVLLVRRHPLDVVASRLDLGFLDFALAHLDERGVAPRVERWGCAPRPETDDPFAHVVWLTAFSMSAFDETASSRSDFVVVDHETLQSDPIPEFQRVTDALELGWTPACEGYLQDSNRPGSGFDTKRVAGAQAGKWRKRLSDQQVAVARDIVGTFPIAQRYADLAA